MRPYAFLLFSALDVVFADELIYQNPLDSLESVQGWVPEGPVNVTVADNDNALELTGSADFVYWVPEVFPDNVRITWEFTPISEPGLSILFFGATSVEGGSIFDPDLAPRNGSYPQYHSSDIRTLHVSYFRRRWPEERMFHLTNLRKSPGFYMVAQGADPLPSVPDTNGTFYRIEVVKAGPNVDFSINDLPLFSWVDDDQENTGPGISGGRIGFRQMNPLVARYRNLEVWTLDSEAS
jgi:hypothetical protein